MTDASPLKFLLATFAGWVNRDQARVIDYQAEVIRVLKEQLGNKRPRLTDDHADVSQPKASHSVGACSTSSPQSSRQTRSLDGTAG